MTQKYRSFIFINRSDNVITRVNTVFTVRTDGSTCNELKKRIISVVLILQVAQYHLRLSGQKVMKMTGMWREDSQVGILCSAMAQFQPYWCPGITATICHPHLVQSKSGRWKRTHIGSSNFSKWVPKLPSWNVPPVSVTKIHMWYCTSTVWCVGGCEVDICFGYVLFKIIVCCVCFRYIKTWL